jgi:hypothetical protein
MNTWIWGPPKWKLLHTLSFAPHAPLYSSEIAQFLNTLAYVLPCVYCRESYGTFVSELTASWGKQPHQVIADGQLALWMYQLHDKVNDKLDTQLTKAQLEETGVTLPGLSLSQEKAMCRKRQITFECLRKRFVLRPLQFCSDDIWEFLCIFALNMDETKEHASEHQLAQWQLFFNLIPKMVQIAGGCAELANTLARHKPSLMHAVTAPGNTIFPAMLSIKALYQHQKFTQSYIEEQHHIFHYAKAHTCSHGSCK